MGDNILAAVHARMDNSRFVHAGMDNLRIVHAEVDNSQKMLRPTAKYIFETLLSRIILEVQKKVLVTIFHWNW